ncbi:hypothetical protein C8J56DRAFT_1061219 [Mycena floridula]|nr:hypothetical protein C8J56DRAFT_1061219 [Mycena floridula]
MSVILLDDSDSSIVYSLGWFPGGGPFEFDSTTHGTTTAGATARIPFSGTYIEVFGTVTAQFSPDSISTYLIDNGASTTFAPDSSTLSADAHKLLFFHSGTLAGGNHTLVITTSVEGGRYYLDWVQFTPSTADGSQTSGSQTSQGTISPSKSTTSTGTTSDSQTIGIPSISPSLSSTTIKSGASVSLAAAVLPSSSSGFLPTSPANTTQTIIVSTSSKAPIGAIVGATVGIMGVILLCCVLLLYRYKMKRRSRHSQMALPPAESYSLPSESGPRQEVMSYVAASGVTTSGRTEKSTPLIQPELVQPPPLYYQAVLQDDYGA